MTSRGGTPALAYLAGKKIDHRVITYDHSEHMDDGYALDTAAVLGTDPDAVFKTLVCQCDTRPVMALVPASATLALKALAKAVGAKKAVMMDPGQAEKLTGYVTGGISPFGSRTACQVVIDSSALDHDTIYVSGGKRTVTVEISPEAFVDAAGALTADIAARTL